LVLIFKLFKKIANKLLKCDNMHNEFCKKNYKTYLKKVFTYKYFFLIIVAIISTQLDCFANSDNNPYKIDNIGWLSKEKKIIIIDFEQTNAEIAQAVSEYEYKIIRKDDDFVVFNKKAVSLNNGPSTSQNRGKILYLDISELMEEGYYYIYSKDIKTKSEYFSIGSKSYQTLLADSLKVFYYQRCGIGITVEYGKNWIHDVCHLGQRQTIILGHPENNKSIDASGGWHDAGDYNKYVPNASLQIIDLINAYTMSKEYLKYFPIDIPENVNDTPDIVDELYWGLKWLLKLQDNDGSMYNRVAADSYRNGKDNPIDDNATYFVTKQTTWSTAIFCAAAAYGYNVFKHINGEMTGFSKTLKDAAEKAWIYLENHKEIYPDKGHDSFKLAAGDSNSNSFQDARYRLLASACLYHVSGKDKYDSYFKKYYSEINRLVKDRENFDNPYINDIYNYELTTAYYLYLKTDRGDEQIKNSLLKYFAKKAAIIENLYNVRKDPYMAYIDEFSYHWGSNLIKLRWAIDIIFIRELNIFPEKNEKYLEIIGSYLHYLHGRNPLNITYLTNLGKKGTKLVSSLSVMEPFHYWFRDKSEKYDGSLSKFGPAPAYLVGGPNIYYSGSDSEINKSIPMKAYKDWNGEWPENSWEINEPSLTYQAAYIFVMSYFLSNN